MTEMPTRADASRLDGLAVYLALTQFLLLATWTVYVIFLPRLLTSVGVEARWAGWVLLADQMLFACFDVAAGFAADRAFRLFARIGRVVAAVGALSCLAFLALPWVAGAGVGPAGFLLLVALWAVTSSALRAPFFGLLARHAPLQSVPRLAGVALAGMGLAAAASPYLGTLMTGVDPRLPFAVSSLALLAVVLGLVAAERRWVPPAGPVAVPAPPAVPAWGFLAALLLAALACQIGVFLNAGPRYLREAGQDWLPWLLPVFWIGFSLAVFSADRLNPRWGSARVFGVAGLVGAGGFGVAALPGLTAAVGGYLVAGIGWGAALASAFGLAAECGRPGRVATHMGLLLAVLAAAAFLRIAASLAGWPKQPDLAPVLALGPVVGWTLGGLLVLWLWRTRRPRPGIV